MHIIVLLWSRVFLRYFTCFGKFQFKLEDSSTSSNSQPPTSPSNGTTQDPFKTTNVSSSTRRQNSTENVPADKEAVTPNRSDDDKGKMNTIELRVAQADQLIKGTVEIEKEYDNRSGQATQAMIQRRRRPKRRSTGVVHVDMEVSQSSLLFFFYIRLFIFSWFHQDIDPENRQESPVDNGDDKDVVSADENRKSKNSLPLNLIRNCNKKLTRSSDIDSFRFPVSIIGIN